MYRIFISALFLALSVVTGCINKRGLEIHILDATSHDNQGFVNLNCEVYNLYADSIRFDISSVENALYDAEFCDEEGKNVLCMQDKFVEVYPDIYQVDLPAMSSTNLVVTLYNSLINADQCSYRINHIANWSNGCVEDGLLIAGGGEMKVNHLLYADPANVTIGSFYGNTYLSLKEELGGEWIEISDAKQMCLKEDAEFARKHDKCIEVISRVEGGTYFILLCENATGEYIVKMDVFVPTAYECEFVDAFAKLFDKEVSGVRPH